jgi:putative addiction module killer protein
MKQIKKYQDDNGKEPFQIWVERLDIQTQSKIYAYIDRVALGAAKKNLKPVGEGVFEIKIDYGPGYRVYFGEVNRTIILLLLGGDKKSQKRDIIKAITFWRDYEQK